MQHRLLFLIFLVVAGCHQENPHRFDITEYGARQGGPVNTKEIQKAVQACHDHGGGTVVIPPGTWYSGTLELLSNVHLHLENGAVLKGSPNLADYETRKGRMGLLHALNARNITISGDGTIDGNGTIYHDESKPHIATDFNREYIRQGNAYMKPGFDFSDGPIWKGERPGMTLVLMHCEDIALRSVTIKDTPAWAVRIGDCDDVKVQGITIRNNLLIPNSDGIHCTHSRNIAISDCDIRAGDDAIIVTGFGDDIGVSGGPGDTLREPTYFGNNTPYAENITVTNCLLQSRSSGVRVGYGSFPIRNCLFSNLVIYDSNRGLGVFARDGAPISNIYFRDIIIRNRLHSGHWWGNGEPIHISSVPKQEGKPGGEIENIRFHNITADSETGILLWGSAESRIRRVELHDIRLHIHESPLAQAYGGNVDLRPALEEHLQIFAFDIPGLYARHTDQLTLRNLQLSWDETVAGYHTHGVHLNDVSGFSMDEKSTIPASPGSGLPDLKIEQ